MPAPTSCFELTMFVKGVAMNVGWSEKYYYDAADFPAALAEVNVLTPLRAACLSNLFTIDFVRISKTDVDGDSIIVEADSPGLTTNPPVFEPSACLLIRIEAGSERRGRRFLHGVPVAVFMANGDYDEGAFESTDTEAYIAHIIGLNYLLRTGVNPGPPVYRIITNGFGQRLTTHRIGRPFGLRRGRRSPPSP